MGGVWVPYPHYTALALCYRDKTVSFAEYRVCKVKLSEMSPTHLFQKQKYADDYLYSNRIMKPLLLMSEKTLPR